MRKETSGRRAWISFMLSLTLVVFSAIPTHADTISFNDVTQTISGQQVSLNVTPFSAPTNASLLAIDAAQTQGGGTNVETVQVGEVSGTICNCGEIAVPGGFPFWALLPLAAVPFFFIHHHRPPPPTPFPTPTPTPPTPVPEPTTLLLLGTGLLAFGAGARRRTKARRLDA